MKCVLRAWVKCVLRAYMMYDCMMYDCMMYAVKGTARHTRSGHRTTYTKGLVACVCEAHMSGREEDRVQAECDV